MKGFDRLNPIAAALYYVSVLTITMFSMDPLLLTLSLLSSVLICAVTGGCGRRGHIFSAGLFVLAAAINPIFVHKGATVLFYLNDNPFTLEAVLYGVFAGAMLTAALYWLRLVTKAFTSDKVLYLFGRLSPKLALLLSMSIRYIGLFRQRWCRIRDSQRALGLYDDGNLIDAVRGRARVLSVLITWTLENGIVTAESMEARGYATGRRTSFALYRIHLSDVLFMVFTVAADAFIFYGMTRTQITYYPEIDYAPLTPWSAATAAVFGVLTLLPLLFHVKEAIRWRILISQT